VTQHEAPLHGFITALQVLGLGADIRRRHAHVSYQMEKEYNVRMTEKYQPFLAIYARTTTAG
jgi:hypothetical protein